jgi:acetyltransferase EpsM
MAKLGASMGVSDIAIFGGRGAGVLAASTVERLAAAGGGRCLGFLNDFEPVGTRIGGHPVLGPFDSWGDLPPTTRFIAPLHKAKEMARRADLIRRLGVPPDRWATLIDPQALIAGDVRYGVGVFAAAYSRVMSSARLGHHVCVRSGSEVSHDCTIEDFAFVGVNSVVCGYATVREGAHIAPGAIVRDGLTIGRYSVVGLGAVVIRNVPDGAIVAGNPARIVGSIGEIEPTSAVAR